MALTIAITRINFTSVQTQNLYRLTLPEQVVRAVTVPIKLTKQHKGCVLSFQLLLQAMEHILFLCLGDLIMGLFVVSPLVLIIEWLSPYVRLSLCGILRGIPLPELAVWLVVGLLWTLLVTCSCNNGLGWNLYGNSLSIKVRHLLTFYSLSRVYTTCVNSC